MGKGQTIHPIRGTGSCDAGSNTAELWEIWSHSISLHLSSSRENGIIAALTCRMASGDKVGLTEVPGAVVLHPVQTGPSSRPCTAAWGGSRGRSHSPGFLPSLKAGLLTWSQLDLQCSPDEGHQRGREVDGHVLVGDGHVHTNQALGTRGTGQRQASQGPPATGLHSARGPWRLGLASQRCSLQVPRTKRGWMDGSFASIHTTPGPPPSSELRVPWATEK